MKLAIIGAGVAGIASAKTFKRLGHEVVVFERNTRPGGVWAEAYPGVHLQVMSNLYGFTDFPWPFAHETYPSAAEILRYIDATIAHFGLDVRVRHKVLSVAREGEGWSLEVATPTGTLTIAFDAVIVCSGNFGEKAELAIPGRESFGGEILTQHDVGDFSRLAGKTVAVVGFGKSAVDMVSFALPHAGQVHHIFRAARWLVPEKLFGIPTSGFSTQRMTSAYNHSWVYPDPKLRKTLERYPWSSTINAAVTGFLIKLEHGLIGRLRSAAAKERMRLVTPTYPMERQLRGTLAPTNFYRGVASGAVEPHRSIIASFTPSGLKLADGREVACDAVIFAVGYKPPPLEFLPNPIRSEVASENDGVQLYRHILHPRLPRLAFIGFNHNPLHIPTAEMSALWIDAWLAGDLTLPSPDEMEASTRKVRDWKRANLNYETTRAYFVGEHLHNYFDVLLADIGLNSRRKRNRMREMNEAYLVADYATLIDEYEKQRGAKHTALPFDT
jgi:dimethylaniline monooxygenase (N-oxide forming)